jgi:hypothetical protein
MLDLDLLGQFKFRGSHLTLVHCHDCIHRACGFYPKGFCSESLLETNRRCYTLQLSSGPISISELPATRKLARRVNTSAFLVTYLVRRPTTGITPE